MNAATIDAIETTVESNIARHIQRRTARRVGQLGVGREGERMIVTGRVPNFHVKQLVIRAIQEIQASDTWSGPLDVGVEVVAPERSASKGEASPAISGWEEQLDEANHHELCNFVGHGFVGPLLRALVARWLPARY